MYQKQKRGNFSLVNLGLNIGTWRCWVADLKPLLKYRSVEFNLGLCVCLRCAIFVLCNCIELHAFMMAAPKVQILCYMNHVSFVCMYASFGLNHPSFKSKFHSNFCGPCFGPACSFEGLLLGFVCCTLYLLCFSVVTCRGRDIQILVWLTLLIVYDSISAGWLDMMWCIVYIIHFDFGYTQIVSYDVCIHFGLGYHQPIW